MRIVLQFLLLQFLIAICLLSVVETQQTLQNENETLKENESGNLKGGNFVLDSKYTYQVSPVEKPKALSFMGALSRARKKSFAGGIYIYVYV
jgi:hypothetical protein